MTPLDVALTLGACLDRARIPYAIGGALALSYWAVPRATANVDLNLFLPEDQLPALCAALKSIGLALDADEARQASEASGLIVTHWHGIRVDLFTPSIEFAWEAFRTRVRVTVAGEAVWLLSAEALAVFKLMFFRTKDIADLQRLLGIRGERLDAAYVHARIAEIMGETDERTLRWDALVAAARSPP